MSKVSKKIDRETKRTGVIKPKHRAVLELMKKGETLSGALIAMSYSAKFVDAHAGDVTRTKSWQALMDEQLPEAHLALRHRELLDKRETTTRVVGHGKHRKVEVVDLGVDTSAVGRGLELAYKIRGKMKDTEPPIERPNVYNLFYQQNVQAQVRSFEDSLKLSIASAVGGGLVEGEARTKEIEKGGGYHDQPPDGTQSTLSPGLSEPPPESHENLSADIQIAESQTTEPEKNFSEISTSENLPEIISPSESHEKSSPEIVVDTPVADGASPVDHLLLAGGSDSSTSESGDAPTTSGPTGPTEKAD